MYMRSYKANGNMDSLLSSLSAHLKSVQSNPQVVGYWVIDVWDGNYGGAKIALQKMNALIHQYTPGKYSICGISANTNIWTDDKAANFSPEGCDRIGIFSYPYGANKVSMEKNIPLIFAS